MNIDEVSNDDDASMQAVKPVWEITFGTEDDPETDIVHDAQQTSDISGDAPDLIHSAHMRDAQTASRCFVMSGTSCYRQITTHRHVGLFISRSAILLPRSKQKQQLYSARRQLLVPGHQREVILRSCHENYCRIEPENMYNTVRMKHHWINQLIS